MRGLAAEDEDPPRASRPFDATRAGFVMGEGAGVVVLEELDARASARRDDLRRGARLRRVERRAPHGAARAGGDRRRRDDARARSSAPGVAPERVDYINAHGTSTPLGDAAETQAIKDVFGDHAYELAVSSTKSMMGHCSARPARSRRSCARSRSTTACCRRRSTTASPDPECDLDYVPNEARERRDRRRALERDGPRRPQRLRPPRARRRA